MPRFNMDCAMSGVAGILVFGAVIGVVVGTYKMIKEDGRRSARYACFKIVEKHPVYETNICDELIPR